jgi:thiazole synthase
VDNDLLLIGDLKLDSRLILGTGGLDNMALISEIINACNPAMVTVAMRRLGKGGESMLLDVLKDSRATLLPNTAGCFTKAEAVLTAKMAREALETDLIKLEVISDDLTLLPDPVELLAATEELANDGFSVLAYTNDDPVIAKKLLNAGAKAIMPLGAPIGSGLGIRNPHNISLITDELSGSVPVILDAGIGTASDAVFAMELGCDAVLLASAINRSKDPVTMAKAFKMAIESGRYAYLSGRIPKRYYAQKSTPDKGKAEWL